MIFISVIKPKNTDIVINIFCSNFLNMLRLYHSDDSNFEENRYMRSVMSIPIAAIATNIEQSCKL